MSIDLYRQYAHYYEVIAKDRDFNKQFDLIRSLLPKNNSRVGTCVLELFAGPAYHSIIASQNSGYEVWAIDSSHEMKNIAINSGFPNSWNYIVNKLPNAISDLPRERKIDCVICLRYSLSYLGIKEVFQLLNELKERLKEGGKIFIELHEISSIINSMRSTDIHLRKGRSNCHEEVECVWPAGDIAWKRESYVAEMNINLKIRSASGETKEATFVSKENIHSAELLEFLAGLCGLRYALVTDKYNPEHVERYFKHSVLIELTNDNGVL